MNYWARRLDVHLSFMHQENGWGESVLLGECQDTSTMIEAFNAIWRHSPRNLIPLKVSITLFDLVENSSASEPLFLCEQRRVSLSRTLDRLNQRFGRDTVYFGEMHGMKDAAPTRIAFNHIPVFNI